MPFNPEAIVTLRERLGLSQYQLAKALDVTPQTVWNWEHGRSAAPRIDVLDRLHQLCIDRGLTDVPQFWIRPVPEPAQAAPEPEEPSTEVPAEFSAFIRMVAESETPLDPKVIEELYRLYREDTGDEPAPTEPGNSIGVPRRTDAEI